MEEKESVYEVYDIRCKDVMDEEGVRFAAIVNEDGKKIAGGFKKGIDPLQDDEDGLQDIMQYSAEVSLKKDHHQKLGHVNYIAFRRDKLILISFPFPVSPFILLVSAEPSVNIEKLADRITRIFGGEKLFSQWDLS